MPGHFFRQGQFKSLRSKAFPFVLSLIKDILSKHGPKAVYHNFNIHTYTTSEFLKHFSTDQVFLLLKEIVEFYHTMRPDGTVIKKKYIKQIHFHFHFH